MIFDLDGGVGQCHHVVVTDTETHLFFFGRGHVAGALATGTLGVHHADFLAAESAPEHHAVALAKRGFEDVELVGVDDALHHVFAQAIGAGDEHGVAKTGFGVGREDDAAGRTVGAHHLHHAHRLEDLEVVETVVDAVADAPVGEQARETAAHGVEQFGLARNVQKALVPAGEAGGRQVFCGGRAANGDCGVLAVLGLQQRVRGGDFGHQVGRQRGAEDDLASQLGATCQVIDVSGIQPVQRPVQTWPCVGVVEHVAVERR